jgi:Ca2+-transporting ATPase
LDEVRQGGAPTDVVALFEAAVLCNDAVMTAEGKPEGDPTETALVAAALKVGVKVAAVRERYPRQAEVPFDSHRKWMATLHGGPSTSIILKGSPESLFGKIALHEFPDLEAEVHKMAESGLRVLAICQEECGEGEKALTEEACRGPYRFLGLVGMGDPPRPEAARSIALCRQAGIEVKMITGDHPRTAGAIGKQLGFSGVPLTGSEMDAMDNETFKREALARQIFARVTPAHKLRLVQVFQQERHVVTMTGDGVNDAPALKQAEIGVAMGSGTVVAQEAADLVLLDDRFSSIEAAVEEGRRVYQNIVKSIAFILPTNFALATIFLAAVLFFPMIGEEKVLPLIPSQILWINLVSAVGLSLPLAFEPIERDAMQRPPRPRNEPILTRFIWFRTLIVSLLSTCSTLALFLWELRHLRDLPFDEAIATAQTTAATTVILFQAFYLLQCRSLGGQPPAKGNPLLWGGIGLVALFQALFIFLPLFQEAFHTRPLSAASFFKAVAAASLIIPVVMVEKWIRSRRSLQNRKGVGH